jgi:hypothetical protein
MLAKIGDGPKVRLIAGGEHAERHIFDHAAESSATKDPDAVGVHQHLQD